MWKTFLLLACVTGSIVSCYGETNPTGETPPTGETEPTDDTDGEDSSANVRRGCGGYPPICGKNEEYYNCSGGCIPRRCSEIGYPLNCDKKCTPGCVCKNGYVRADNGNCIPIPDCPSCGGDKNAQQGCGNNCGNTCSTYNKPRPPCPPGCIFNGCNCRKGFVYDNNVKACVKPEACTPICQANEEYSPCTNGGCDARNCSQVGKPVPCIKLDPKSCIKGCVCVKGYLRASNGTCVPKDQCTSYPPICGKNEVYYNCSGACTPRRCSEVGFPVNCDEKCTPGCVCKDNYVRADNGTCIPILDCPSCGGDKNAQQGCSNYCGHTCSTYNKPPTPCPLFCMVNGCDCRKGFVYDNNLKVCVKPEDCTPTCQANEEYSPCTNGGCDARNCSQVGKPVPCIKLDPKSCIKGCVCVKGYLRASNGTCVPKDQCTSFPPICGKNEVYYNCSGACTPRRCSEVGFPVNCDEKCTPGCVCKDNYVRADNGTCIPILDCPSCGGDKNAQQGCSNYCGHTCSTYNKPAPFCPLFCMVNGCDCRKGFVYDNNLKACVKPGDCTPTCQANEEYSSCTNGGCDARNCSQVGKPVPCIKLDPKSCIKGCVCVKGYLRASNGTCVPKDQCTSTGYPPICHKNEEYYNCSGGCTLRQCSEVGFPLNCDKKCTPGCVCKNSYVRADNGTCIPILDCPSCGGDKNAEQGCGSNCGRTCSTYKNPPKQCPIGCIFNGCTCRKGFVYDNNVKACVKPEDCTPICQANEEYSTCTNGGCDARNCSQVGKPVPCVRLDPKYCIKGCVCVKGYLRASNGTCVPKDQCTPKCDKPNEVYDVCPAPCPPKRCNVNKAVVKCKAPPKPGDPDCEPGCRCANNYYRNATGTCVLKKKCEKPLICDRPNEVYDACPAICPPQECGVNPAVILCMRNPEYGDPACKPNCVCIDGYVRNYARECIPKDKCPKCTGQNEYFENCIQGCSNQTCGSINQTYFCPYQKGCKSGCRCSPGFYRNKNNICVPENECPKTCGKNEHWAECYYSCGGNETCDDIGKSYNCPAQVKCKSGCRCDKGYWRNKDNVCIPENQCPKTCGKNEHWAECYYSCGGNETCDDIGKSYNCPAQVKCKSGCRCDKGYWRNKDNVCIPENQCPKPCGQNEYFENCINGCTNQSCADYGQTVISCPAQIDGQCPSGCRCKPKYYRNGAGVCVPESECPKPCGQNEYFENCILGCTNQSCAEYGRPPKSCPLEIAGQCPSGCRCKPKYYRNGAGVCVPESECPRCYGRNEYYEYCIQGCSNQTCDDIGKIFHFPNEPAGQCKSGCRCVEGTWRNGSNVCVPQEECPKTCGKNEHWDECYYSCGGNQTCEDIGKSYSCPAQQKCNSGCRCDKGYWRNKDNVCIPENQCPKLCGENEYFEKCIIGCATQSCSEVGRPASSCPGVPLSLCPSGCRCKPKYYRNGAGVCIPESECPRCYGKNEYYEYCIKGCYNQTCDDIGKQCPSQPAGQCKAGCICYSGGYRNASNVCVTREGCPKSDCPADEVWRSCPTVKCDADYCAKTKDSPQTCPGACDKPRCDCDINKKRDRKTGKCIPIAECPKFKCGINEEYQVCPLPCPGDNCSNYTNPSNHCATFIPGFICKSQCRCIKDYYRDANGTCIPARNCPTDTSVTTTVPPTTTGTSTSGSGTGLTGILDGITAFTGLCLYNRMKSSPSENIIMSAMSVFTPIAELCLYSEGPAYDQCIKVLNLKDKQDIRDTFPKLGASYEGQTSVNISTAAIVYSDINHKLSDSVKKDAVVVFNASAEELDFSKNQEAADTINAWVESKTNNRIQDLVTKDMFSALTRLVLVNALYFKGKWKYEFNKTDTKEEDFYLSDGTTKKTMMMYQEIKDLDYGEIPSLDCKAVRVYYKGKTSSMIIVLPNTKNGTLELAKNLQDSSNWKKITDSFAPQKVQLYLPRFKITTTTDLKDLMMKANITDWFNCANSGLEGLLEKPEPVCITEAIQKAFVEVNEEGAEAAAANAVVVTTRSLPLPPPVIKEFKANRAFLYYLRVGSIVSLCGAFYG